MLNDFTGFYDKTCIVYTGFDKREFPQTLIGSPGGDYDDFFTPAFDLSNMTAGECNLNFMSSGAFRITDSRIMKDTLQIAYSTNCGESWNTLTNITKEQLANKGVVSIKYAPLWMGDWVLQSFNIPTSVRTDKVFFRFRFKPGADDLNAVNGRTIPGTGNQFFIDRINVSAFKAGVNTLLGEKSIALAPNPTNGSSQLIIKSNSRETATVSVTDITGKVVYTTQQQLNGNITNIEIPASAIKTKGVYMVRVVAGELNQTEKLVAY